MSDGPSKEFKEKIMVKVKQLTSEGKQEEASKLYLAYFSDELENSKSDLRIIYDIN